MRTFSPLFALLASSALLACSGPAPVEPLNPTVETLDTGAPAPQEPAPPRDDLFITAGGPASPDTATRDSAADARAWAQLDDWARAVDRRWVGVDLWANRLQDWEVADQRLECVDERGLARRTVHSLRARLGTEGDRFELSVRVGRLSDLTQPTSAAAAAGFLIGAGGADLDPRAAALVHDFAGTGGGWFCGVDGLGKPFICSNAEPWPEPTGETTSDWPEDGVELELWVRAERQPERGPDAWNLHLSTRDALTRTEIGAASAQVQAGITPFTGNIALVSHPGPDPGENFERYAFRDWRVRGDRFVDSGLPTLGPVLSMQHTLHRGTLHLSAQMFPLGEGDPSEARLERLEGDRWVEAARANIARASHNALFRVSGWKTREDTVVRVVQQLGVPGGGLQTMTLQGLVPRNPAAPGELVIAAFTGNHNNSHNLVGGFGSTGPEGRGDWTEGLWFPHADLTSRVALHDPDLLFFSGDQVYEGGSPTFADREHPELDYLYKWYLFLWAWREHLNVRPSVIVPDDHDVYQGNLWGAGGRFAKRDTDGGYTMPPSFVRLVERTQTSHLPAPATNAPLSGGLRSWFTELLIGDVSIALLEDRKWKSGPALPTMPETGTNRPDHVNRPDIHPRAFDLPGLDLLGPAQEAFLQAWAGDWSGARMKLALSQSPFAGLATHHGANLTYLTADLDSNGWPQAGRKRAVTLLRKAFSPHVAGDQHLATLAQHGLEEHRDAPWSFVVPSTANFYPRAWLPPAVGRNRSSSEPDWAGDHVDGLGNLVSVFAATNPEPQGKEPVALHDGMAGYGIVRIDTAERQVTFECWPRWADPRTDDQYPGWPRTTRQLDQYGAEPAGYLDLTVVSDPPPALGPAVQLRDGSGDLVYGLRLAASVQRLPLHGTGPWRLTVQDPETSRSSTYPIPQPDEEPLELRAEL